jgi:hypothetical protein
MVAVYSFTPIKYPIFWWREVVVSGNVLETS